MGSGVKVEICTKKLLDFGSWGDFLSLGHCLVKRDIE
jgi:hypothetical protein